MSSNLIYLHIPKTGGSTFDWILSRNYQLENTFSVIVVDDTRVNTQDFIDLSQNRKNNIHLLKGHMDFGLHYHLKGKTDYITFLRKPEDRIISYYYHVINSPVHRLHDEVINNDMSMYDFVANINQGDVNNGQVRQISGINDSPNLMLEKALENIENHFSFVGNLEKYNESLVLLKNKYGWKTPYYKVLKKNNLKPNKSSIPLKTLELINELNEADNILYDQINSRLEKLIKDEDFLKFNLLKIEFSNILYNSFIKNVVKKSNKILFS